MFWRRRRCRSRKNTACRIRGGGLVIQCTVGAPMVKPTALVEPRPSILVDGPQCPCPPDGQLSIRRRPTQGTPFKDLSSNSVRHGRPCRTVVLTKTASAAESQRVLAGIGADSEGLGKVPSGSIRNRERGFFTALKTARHLFIPRGPDTFSYSGVKLESRVAGDRELATRIPSQDARQNNAAR